MKSLRRSVAVILLLSTLLALTSCGKTTIGNDKKIGNFWNTCIIEKKINRISCAFDVKTIYGEFSSLAIAPTPVDDKEVSAKLIEEISKLGDVACTLETLDESEEKEIYSKKKTMLNFLWDAGMATITLVDGYVTIRIYDTQRVYKIEYDYEALVQQLKTIMKESGIFVAE